MDVGFNAEFKKHVATQFDAHMKADMEKWQTGKFTASERRILISKWVANATEATYDNANIPRIFEKCGISLPIDGSQDARINIQGLEDYSVGDDSIPNEVDNVPNEVSADTDADLLEADVTEEEDVSNYFNIIVQISI